VTDQRNGGIAWTDETWNPMAGCTIHSPGCANCYAMGIAGRFHTNKAFAGLVKQSKHGWVWSGETVFHPERLAQPLRWRKPKRVFVNSASDIFHDGFTNEQIAAVFGVMAACPQHTFQVLTKRSKRMQEWFEWVARTRNDVETCGVCVESMDWYLPAMVLRPDFMLQWPLPNVWLGVSVENQAAADERIPDLLACPAAVRWVSAEPLLEAVDLGEWLFGFADEPGIRKIDWLVVGGESGPAARPFHLRWARDLRNRCDVHRVAFFMKQIGERAVGDVGETQYFLKRDNSEMDAWPWDLRIREWPKTREQRIAEIDRELQAWVDQ